MIECTHEVDHDVSQLTVEARPTAGAAVRRAVVDWIDGHPRLDDVLLAITELVNNAVMHGGLEPDDGLTVTVGPDGGPDPVHGRTRRGTLRCG